MKRMIGIAMVIVMLAVACMCIPVSAEATEIRVQVNGVDLEFDQPPIIENGRTLVPFRAIFEALSMAVDYKEENGQQIVTAEQGDKKIDLVIGADKFHLNGTPIPLDVPAKIKNSRTLIPVRAVSEALGCEVSWDGAERLVTIKTTDGKTLIKSRNLVNPATLSVGYASKQSGQVIDTATVWRTSNFLAVQPGQIIVSENSKSENIPIQFLAAYDENKTVIPDAGVTRGDEKNGTTYVVPEGVVYVRISVSTNQISDVDNGGWMVAVMRYDEEKVTFAKWGFISSVDGQVNTTEKPVSAPPTPDNIDFPNDGGNSLQAEKDTLSVKEYIKLDAFPQNIKKGIKITFSAKFDQFEGLTIGNGYDHGRGDWLAIDNTSVTWKGFGANRDGNPKPHGLSIENDISVTLTVAGDQSGICSCTVSSGGREKTLEFLWINEQNGIPFAFGEQEMTDVKLCSAITDMDCPVWVFGDSYFGSADNRVIGQLFKLGYGENCLIDGQAGQNSDGGYADLKRLLQLGGMPKKLVWMLGMNDSIDVYKNVMQELEVLAQKYNFDLILMTVPIVPNKKNPGLIGEYVISSGHRYVDARSAVGSDENGSWHDGYLAEDQIHPTASGAKAIAEQLVKDVPEIEIK